MENEVTKKRKPKNPVRHDFDRLASVFAVALSIAAILISLLEVQTARTQQRATAWPYLQITGSYSDSGYRVVATNKGVGPAIVGQFQLIDADGLTKDLDTLISDTLGEDAFSYETYKASDLTNSVIARGETVNLFSVPWEPRTRKLVDAWSGKINIQACYCSIHKDCWTAELNEHIKKEANECGITSEILP